MEWKACVEEKQCFHGLAKRSENVNSTGVSGKGFVLTSLQKSLNPRDGAASSRALSSAVARALITRAPFIVFDWRMHPLLSVQICFTPNEVKVGRRGGERGSRLTLISSFCTTHHKRWVVSLHLLYGREERLTSRVTPPLLAEFTRVVQLRGSAALQAFS